MAEATVHAVVAYDIADARRRNRVARCLEGYGTRVNYSVFECVLKAAAFRKLKRELAPLLKNRVDSVRFYPMCRECVDRIEVLGRGPKGFEDMAHIYL
jgi:CRISPR-associated protein Cas2